MSAEAADLARRKCRPCEGGVPPLSPAEVQQLLPQVPQWRLTADGKAIRREWRVKDFATGLDLTGYRNVAIELSTHAVGGLSENDFILAAKIDQLPVALKT
jgi:4a-hydroxytetrahydrobiopterin dehydratase